jgi:putative thioredoxin
MSNPSNPYAQPGTAYNVSLNSGTEPPPQGALVKDTTTQGFAADVIQESKNQPVLVDFWAPWCGPCRQLAPALERVVKESNGRVKLVKMNIDDHPSIPGQLGIQSIPAVIAFVGGQPVDGFMGAIPESQIRTFIDRVAKGGARPDVFAEALEEAAKAAEEGNAATAKDIYEAILEQEPGKIEALTGLAGLLLDSGDSDGAAAILDRIPADKRNQASVAALLARIELEKQVSGLGDFAEAEARVIANPKDLQARYDLALMQNARGMRDQAAESLLAIVKADRTWNEAAARGQLLKFFEAWGPTDETTLAARRKLSSLLFS